MTTIRYVHQELGVAVEAIGGSYTLTKEATLPLDDPPGGEVLYTVGHAVFDTTCCGVGGCGYATVLGRVRRWQADRDAEGHPVTEAETIDDPAQQERLAKQIKRREHVLQVSFR